MISRWMIAAALLAGCQAGGDDEYKPLPPGGGSGGGGAGDDDGTPPPPPPDALGPPAFADSYAVSWTRVSVVDINGEGAPLTCPSVYCAPILATTNLTADVDDDAIQFVFSMGINKTYVDAGKEVQKAGVWSAAVPARTDGVGDRQAFDIKHMTSRLSGKITWTAKAGTPATSDDLIVTYSFAATPN